MPLPTGGVWPPPDTSSLVQNRLTLWAAWYQGEPLELERCYFDPNYPSNWIAPEGWYAEPAQYHSQLPQSGSRTFWGSQVPAGELRTKLHVPVAADLAALSADLLFAEPPALEGADDATTERLQHLEDAGLWTAMRESAEICAAMGGVYLRVVWDTQVADHPWVVPVPPESAIPEWRWDRLEAVTFWRIISPQIDTFLGQPMFGKVIRHLERHESGVILHGVYAGSATELGEQVSLTTFEETAYLPPEIPTGTPLLTAEYVPNLRPNRVWRQIPKASNYGRSDFSGLEGTMDSLDEVWSSWVREVRLAKLRIVADQSVLESRGRGKGARFDSEREVFTLISAGADGQSPLTPIQFPIRSPEYEQTCKALLEQVVRGAGYSTETLSGSSDATAMTATEVSSRDRRSMITRGRKVSYWRAGLTRILTALLAVDNAQFGAGVSEEPPTVAFPETIFSSLDAMAQSLQLLASAGAVSTRTKVETLHPKWTEEEIEEEIAAIEGEQVPPEPPVPPDVQGQPVLDEADAEDGPAAQTEADDGQASPAPQPVPSPQVKPVQQQKPVGRVKSARPVGSRR